MRSIAKFVGVIWMVACGLLWISTGFLDFGIADILPPAFANWSVIGLIASGGFGLAFLCLLLGGVGYGLWAWGSAEPDDSQGSLIP
tara:strand:+ start:2102 stop:2359 length:258 start_codon:yes stop_codon:yes gene_type:complete